MRIKGLLVPERLVRLVEAGRWRGWLSAETLARVAPGMDARIELCDSFDFMLRESRLVHETAGIYDGARQSGRLPLPWLDQGQSLFIAVGDYGDDTGFALDYRDDPDCPKVVGGLWDLPAHFCRWQVVATSFDEFADALGF